MLTDTTERSPTYCSPPFRKFDDTTATESWSFLFLPYQDTPKAWERIIKRQPKCVEWTEQEVRALVSEDKVARTYEIVRKISTAELMRFKVGLDGLKYRPLGKGDSAVGIVSETEKASLLSPDGFHRRQLEAARKAGAQIGVIYVGRKESFKEVSDFLAQWNPQVRGGAGAGPEHRLPAGRCDAGGPEDAAQRALDLHHGAVGSGDGQLHDLGGAQQPEAH